MKRKKLFEGILISCLSLGIIGIASTIINCNDNKPYVRCAAANVNDSYLEQIVDTTIFESSSGRDINRYSFYTAGQTITSGSGKTWNVKTTSPSGALPYFYSDFDFDYTQIGSTSLPAKSINFTIDLGGKFKIINITTTFELLDGVLPTTDTFCIGEKRFSFSFTSPTDDFVSKNLTDHPQFKPSEVEPVTTFTIVLESDRLITNFQSISFTIEEFVDPIEDLINKLHMDEHKTWQCNLYYNDAKEAYSKLNDGQKETFRNEHPAEYARLVAWARAHGEIPSQKDGSFIHDPTVYNNIVENNVTIIAVSASIAVVTIVTVLVIAIKKERKHKVNK